MVKEGGVMSARINDSAESSSLNLQEESASLNVYNFRPGGINP